MAIVRELNGVTPKFGKRCFLAENAAVIGDVVMGDDCSIWYSAVLRGDVNPIIMGDRVNIQDGAVLHTLHKRSVVEIGNDVSVGHNAVIPDNTIIAAGAVVLSNQVLEPGIYAGIPAKKVKEGSEAIATMAHNNAQGYMKYKAWFDDGIGGCFDYGEKE